MQDASKAVRRKFHLGMNVVIIFHAKDVSEGFLLNSYVIVFEILPTLEIKLSISQKIVEKNS